jgi:3-methylfumaryl-CoA hydratase
MWAGSCIDFMRPLRVGDALTRRSRIDDVRLKEGRSGPLVFVKVRHEIHANGALAIVDTHDIVYRDVTPNDAATPAAQASFSSTPDVAATGAAGDATWTRRIVPDDVLLFRYSALTFNGHRIHYDRRYVTEVEGYPGLIVHGPLIATLLLELVWRRRPEARVTHFSFKAVKPIFDLAPFDVCGRALDAQHQELWALAPDGAVAMQAQATLA